MEIIIKFKINTSIITILRD